MRKITKMGLDELAKTMSVIPESELVNFIGGGETTYYSTRNELTGHLSSWTMCSNGYTEAIFLEFSDGTFAMHVDGTASNTSHQSEFILKGSCESGWYFEGKRVVAWGHTHRNSSSPGTNDLKLTNNFSGLSSYIYYNGSYHNYQSKSN